MPIRIIVTLWHLIYGKKYATLRYRENNSDCPAASIWSLCAVPSLALELECSAATLRTRLTLALLSGFLPLARLALKATFLALVEAFAKPRTSSPRFRALLLHDARMVPVA